MNQSFADRISEIYQPGDVVWVHDYQLMVLPCLLREKYLMPPLVLFTHSFSVVRAISHASFRMEKENSTGHTWS
jgi:trehalose-6-phosphate synthase